MQNEIRENGHKSKLQLEIVKNINGQKKVCVLQGEYFAPAEYIQNLIDQLENDIFPLFNTKELAPFTVSRNTFCFIDHVSALKYGIKNQTPRIKKIISEFANFDSYIQGKYKLYAGYIVQVYRHDLVHNIRPFPHKFNIIDKGGAKSIGVSWFFISSDIGANPPQLKTFNNLTDHFKKVRNRKGLCHLRYSGNQIVINNYCLFFDLVNYLKEYEELLRKDKKEQGVFVDNYKKIAEKYFSLDAFVLDKRKDTECKL